MSKNARKMMALGVALVVGTGFSTIDASSLTKMIEAGYYNIKVSLNGQNKTVANEPFMYNNSVYVGLRDFSEITGYDVTWDSANKTVKITGGASEEIDELEYQNALLKAENELLKQKIAQLDNLEDEKEDEDSTSIPDISSTDIKNLIDDLEDDYEDEYDVSWEYEIEVDDEFIIFNVYYDSRYDDDEFNDISDSEMDKYLEDMCDDIQYELGDYEIQGMVIDEEEDEEVYTFDMSDNGKFDLSPVNSKTSLRRFEDYLTDEETELPNIAEEGLDGITIDIDSWELDEDDDFEEIVFDIYTDLDATYADAWNDLSSSDLDDIEDWLDDIAEEIEDQFGADEISGYIWNDYDKLIVKYEDGRVSHEDFRED